jgi:hypothetical protein
MIGFTPPRLGRGHLLFGAALGVTGLTLMYDALSSTSSPVFVSGTLPPRIISGAVIRNSWFFPNSYADGESTLGLAALAVAVVWVGGSVGWWIVHSIIWHWWKQQRRLP